MRPRRRRLRSAPFAAIGLVAACLVVGLTAANTVATSKLEDDQRAVATDDLAPTDCSALTLANLVIGNNGTNQADLLVGSAAGTDMDGSQGSDCVLGGGGNDTLRGSQGTDVCVGGPGTDTFHPSCETQIQ